ncbi:MAG TPA: DUF3179 domain-containing (seleno)protein [Gaiellaceae bacterium]|nr:DUF3179 domain-containing (seleno)protein [Gaiellaceae bacterium]
MHARVGALLLLVGLASGCAGDSGSSGRQAVRAETIAADPFGPVPATPKGPLDPRVKADIEAVLSGFESEALPRDRVRKIGASEDARAAWILSDLLRLEFRSELVKVLVGSFEQLTGSTLTPNERSPEAAWRAVTDRLIAWELPAPPGYTDYKARLFTLVEPRWAPFFRDRHSDVDWRFVTWGGVFIDDRALGDPGPCERGCIPALDDPAVTDAAGGSWYPDDSIVFGVVVNGEARAYPRNIMEVHELVNDTLGARRIALPYCTLCASAQAYFTDTVGKRNLVLRTSGLLSRSNKVMYELRTRSLFDTFKGRAVSGPLREAGVTLEQVTVVTSTWGAWKEAHPETTIVARDGGIGRDYPVDPLHGRDDDGPIFPVGDVDPRLPVQEQVVGIVTPDGTPVAFPAAAARGALQAGKDVELAGVRLELEGDGLRAVLADGAEVVSHQAFWFAWSQFHPRTVLWTPRPATSR